MIVCYNCTSLVTLPRMGSMVMEGVWQPSISDLFWCQSPISHLFARTTSRHLYIYFHLPPLLTKPTCHKFQGSTSHLARPVGGIKSSLPNLRTSITISVGHGNASFALFSVLSVACQFWLYLVFCKPGITLHSRSEINSRSRCQCKARLSLAHFLASFVQGASGDGLGNHIYH